MEREVGGGIGMGNTCKPLAVSFQCMTKSTTNKKKKKKRKWVGELGQKEKQNDGQEAAIVIQNGDNDGGNYGDCSGRNRNRQI